MDKLNELEKEFTDIRRKDRRNMLMAGLLSALLIAMGTVLYVSKEANSAANAYNGYQYAAAQGSYAVYPSGSGNSGAGFGGGCGMMSGGSLGGGSLGGGGCCGGGAGGSVAGTSLSDLEKQGLAKFQQETGATDVKAKASNFGCHIQIDISDASGKVVRSYGYQGGPLYVIQ